VNRILFVVLARKGHDQSFKKNSTVVALERFIQSQRTVKITGHMAPSNFLEFRFTLGVQLKNPLLEKKHTLSDITQLENIFRGIITQKPFCWNVKKIPKNACRSQCQWLAAM